MHALGCHADDAFDRMRRISQTHHIKLTQVARRIINTGGLNPATGQAADGNGVDGPTS